LRIPSAADDPASGRPHQRRFCMPSIICSACVAAYQYQPGTDLLDQRYQHARSLASELTTLAQQSLHAQAPVDWQEQMQIRAQSSGPIAGYGTRPASGCPPRTGRCLAHVANPQIPHRWFERSSQHIWPRQPLPGTGRQAKRWTSGAQPLPADLPPP